MRGTHFWRAHSYQIGATISGGIFGTSSINHSSFHFISSLPTLPPIERVDPSQTHHSFASIRFVRSQRWSQKITTIEGRYSTKNIQDTKPYHGRMEDPPQLIDYFNIQRKWPWRSVGPWTFWKKIPCSWMAAIFFFFIFNGSTWIIESNAPQNTTVSKQTMNHKTNKINEFRYWRR